MARAYPRLLIDLDALYQNASYLIGKCRSAGISVAGVIKGFTGLIPPTEVMTAAGAAQIASSRTEQLSDVKAAGVATPTMLLRIPMLSEVPEVIRTSDYSLESEVSVLDALETECEKRGVRHKVIIMAEMGDLREGIFDPDELVRTCVHVENDLPHLELAGVGTNLGCYGSIRPTPEKLSELVAHAERVESAIGRKLDIVSGGATSSYPLVDNGTMPARINHLRIGEGMLIGTALTELWALPHLPLEKDVFLLEAEVIECRDKPTHPIGEIAFDAFGNRPTYVDRGVRRRALIGIGKADVGNIEWLVPKLPGAEVLGGSSDHTILDVQDCTPCPAVGDVCAFRVPYGGMLFLTARRDMPIVYLPRQERTR